jgi:hypothetical protein
MVFRQRTATIFYEPLGIKHGASFSSLRFMIIVRLQREYQKETVKDGLTTLRMFAMMER